MTTILTIAGYDPSSGAGITADLAVFAAHGVFGTSCVSALTVQSTLGVQAVYPVSADVIYQTLACLEADLPPSGIKIGMLGTAECVATVVEYLQALRHRDRRPVVVLDPVIRSTSGSDLLDLAGLDLLRRKLLPLVDWITPNRLELSLLTASPVAADEFIEQARTLGGLFPDMGVVVTGGDRLPPDDLLLTPSATGAAEHWLPGEHVATHATHGTGCAFSSALLCRLVEGLQPIEAVRAAKAYVAEAMRRAAPVGHGPGPINHLWPLRRE